MRVGLDGRAFQPGFKSHLGRGIGLYAAELCAALARSGEAELTLFLDPALPVDESRLPPEVGRARYARSWIEIPGSRVLGTQLCVPAATRRRGLDVFHVLAHGDAPLAMGPRTVVTVHDVILELMRDLYAAHAPLKFRLARALERRVIRRAPFLIADSEASRADVVRLFGVDPGRVRVAPLGVDPRFRPPAPEAVSATRARFGFHGPVVLYVGGIDARKNVHGLLAGFARLRAGRSGACTLVLAGQLEGAREFPALRREIARLGLGDAVRLLGYVDDDDLPLVLAAADVFAFPSLYEGFGLPPLEAMACGTPVVATRAGSLDEVLGDAALTVPPGDAGALAGALAAALDDGAVRADLRARGLARAARFTWEATARATLDAYRAAVARRTEGSA